MSVENSWEKVLPFFEDELQALAEGVFRVLDDEEKPRRLWDEGRKPTEPTESREPLVIGIE